MSFLSTLRSGDLCDDPGPLRSVSSSVLLFLAAALMGFLLFMHRLGIGGDNLDYLVYIRSLMAGDWHVIRGWRYPPGYPIFASLVMRLFRQEVPMTLNDIRPFTIYFLHSVNILCFAGAVAVFWSWASHRAAPRWIPFVAAALWGLHQLSAATASQIATEPLFLFVSLLALGCWRALLYDDRSSGWMLAAAALTTTAAIFVRTAGLAIAVSSCLIAAWNWRKHPRPWLILAVCLTPFILYGAYLIATGQTTYIDIMVRGSMTEQQAATSLPARLSSNLLRFRGPAINLLIPKIVGDHGIFWLLGGASLQPVYMALMLVVLLCGWGIHFWRHRLTLDSVYCLVTLGMLAVQPYFEQRYFIPILPFLLVYWLTGLSVLLAGACRLVHRPAAIHMATRWCVFALLAWSLATNLYAGAKNWRNIMRLWNEPPWAPERYIISRETDFADFMVASQWIGSNTPTNALIVSRKATFVILAARRTAWDTGAFRSPEDLWQQLRMWSSERPTFILYDSFDPQTSFGATRLRMLDPLLERHPNHMEVVFRSPGSTIVYRVRASPPSAKHQPINSGDH